MSPNEPATGESACASGHHHTQQQAAIDQLMAALFSILL
jgi:hypothetical protein